VRSPRLLALAIPGALVLTLTGCLPVALFPRVSDLPAAPPPPTLAIGDCPWDPTATATMSPSPTPSADPIAATEAIALSDDLFWPMIEAIPDPPAISDFEALASALAGCPLESVVAFEARMTLALYALDGPDNHAWYEENDPLGLGFVSEDTFLYARCATVLGGKVSWAAAVEDGTLDWGSDSPDTEGYSEFLLYIGAEAAQAQGMDMGDYYGMVFETIPISYETGSNTTLWGE
jgi:hypothetical protein